MEMEIRMEMKMGMGMEMEIGMEMGMGMEMEIGMEMEMEMEMVRTMILQLILLLGFKSIGTNRCKSIETLIANPHWIYESETVYGESSW